MFWRHRQPILFRQFAHQLQTFRPDALAQLSRAMAAPEPLPSNGQPVIPPFAVKAPPEAMRIERRAVATGANDLDRMVPGSRFENMRGVFKAVLIAGHVTSALPFRLKLHVPSDCARHEGAITPLACAYRLSEVAVAEAALLKGGRYRLANVVNAFQAVLHNENI